MIGARDVVIGVGILAYFGLDGGCVAHATSSAAATQRGVAVVLDRSRDPSGPREPGLPRLATAQHELALGSTSSRCARPDVVARAPKCEAHPGLDQEARSSIATIVHEVPRPHWHRPARASSASWARCRPAH